MAEGIKTRGVLHWTPPIIVMLVLAAAMYMAFEYAPREATMGDVQRLVYLHVAVAWCGLLGCVAMGVCGAMYLARREAAWDQWSRACGELGWLTMSLTLVTGSLWAHEAWNTWWTWEPRLTASFILWIVFGSYFVVRSGIDDPDRRARFSAVLAIMALADVPLIVMATRWFRGMHPTTPEMDPKMRATLLVCVLSITTLVAWLARLRQRQLQQEALVERLETECEERMRWEH